MWHSRLLTLGYWPPIHTPLAQNVANYILLSLSRNDVGALHHHPGTHQCRLQACGWYAFPQPLQLYWSQSLLDKSC